MVARDILSCDDLPHQPIEARICKVEDEERRESEEYCNEYVQGQDGCTGRDCIQDDEKKDDHEGELGRQVNKEYQGFFQGRMKPLNCMVTVELVAISD